MSDTNCPYCEADIEINHDDGYGYTEDDLHQQECSECGKTFTYTTSISFYYSLDKADCLNGGEHDYKEFKRYGYPDTILMLRCNACGYERLKGEKHD